MARFLLDRAVLPMVTDTLHVAEAFRHALLRRYQRHRHRQKYGLADKSHHEPFRSEVLAGKDADGRCLHDHRHAFYLPTAEGPDPRQITHVTVVAASGFGPDEVAALNALRLLRWNEEAPELQVQLVGLGDRGHFNAPLLAAAQVWVSATPFVVTRYPKRRGSKRDRPEDYVSLHAFARHVLQQELGRRPELPPVLAVEPQETIGPQQLRPIQFRRLRAKRGDDGARRPAGGFRLTFAAPAAGPIAVGHSCHFGLGLFVPESPSQSAARGAR